MTHTHTLTDEAPPQGFVIDGPGVAGMLAVFAALHEVTAGTPVDYVDVNEAAAVAGNVARGAALVARAASESEGVVLQVLTGDPQRPGDVDAVRFTDPDGDVARVGEAWRRAVDPEVTAGG